MAAEAVASLNANVEAEADDATHSESNSAEARLDMALGTVVDAIRRDAMRRPTYLSDSEVAAGGE